MPEISKIEKVEVARCSFPLFVQALEEQLAQGYVVDFEESPPCEIGILFSAWCVKVTERRTRAETLEIARVALDASRTAKREQKAKQ